MLSSERDFEDFLVRALKAPLRTMLERAPIPAAVQPAVAYQLETEDLVAGMRDRAREMREYRLRKRESVEAVVAAADDDLVFEPWMLAVADRVVAKEEAA